MLKKLYRVALLFVLAAFVTETKAQVTFIENKGQWESNIKYRAEIPGGLLIMEDGQISYILHEKDPFDKIHDEGHYDQPVKMHFFRVVFEGSNKNLHYQTDFQSTAYYNYFIGNDPQKWASGVHGFGKITVKELYPGIDLELFSSARNIVKYNLIVKPGADPDKIKVRYEGLDDMRLSGGRLHLKTSIGELTEMPPVCYQFADTSVKYVKTDYSLKGNVLSFDIKEKYNHRKSFIIDPELVFSTYSGAFGDNFGFTATFDNNGNGYSGGASYVYNQNGQFSDGSFPVTPGAFQMTFGGGVGFLARDAAIFKVSADGSNLIYATYIGGSHNDEPHSMIVNSKGELVVLGTTFSNDFPVSGFDNFHNLSADIFVFVLSADGKSMVGSTYIGGPGM
ncbi:MAG TPA: hypothetical protein VEC12_07880, partial [Bacteroidia bacterium]|nr:hypothetical protein [Bacteroidia bacterium]